MKKIVRILASLVMGLMCVNCASAKSGNEEKVSETRSVNPFHSIEVESVASVFHPVGYLFSSCRGRKEMGRPDKVYGARRSIADCVG